MTAQVDTGERGRSWKIVLLRICALVVTVAALAAFSVALAKVTLTPSPASEDLVHANLRPGNSLRQYAEDYTFLAACKQAGGNLLLGVPFGLLLPILVPRRLRMLRMIFLTAVVMSLVELIQGALVAGRAFDVDDVILNTSGALLGYLMLGRRLSHRYHSLGDQPSPAAGPVPDSREPDAVTDPQDAGRTPWFKRRNAAPTDGEAAPATSAVKRFPAFSSKGSPKAGAQDGAAARERKPGNPFAGPRSATTARAGTTESRPGARKGTGTVLRSKTGREPAAGTGGGSGRAATGRALLDRMLKRDAGADGTAPKSGRRSS